MARCQHLRWGVRALAAALLLVAGRPARAEPGFPPPASRPIAWQDPSPFAQLFLQLPFEAPEPLAPGVLEVGLRTLYSNTIARERSGSFSADVALESAAPTAFARVGLPLGFELQLALPGSVSYAGFLGRPIKFVEGLFDATNPLRAGRTPKAAWLRLLRDGGTGLDWSGVGGSAGDPWVGVKRRIRFQDDWAPALAWRAAVAFPVAPLPWGSGAFEVGAGVIAGWTAGATSLVVEADAMLPAPRPVTSAQLQPRPHFALQLGAARRFGRWVTGMVQASTHSSAIGGTGLDVVDGTTTYLLAGVGVEPSPSTSFAFALVENVLNPTRGADISAVLEMSWRR